MQNTDKIEFVKTLNAMALMKKTTLNPDVMDLWWDCFTDWNIEDFKVAARHLLKVKTFMPQPNDFNDLRKAGKPTSGEVFAGLMQWLEYSPNGYSVKRGTPHAIATAIRAIGGADAYALCESSKLHFIERRFCEHYDQISSRQEIRDAVPEIALDQDIRARLAGTFQAIGQKLDS
jgi:hypothetical protein